MSYIGAGVFGTANAGLTALGGQGARGINLLSTMASGSGVSVASQGMADISRGQMSSFGDYANSAAWGASISAATFGLFKGGAKVFGKGGVIRNWKAKNLNRQRIVRHDKGGRSNGVGVLLPESTTPLRLVHLTNKIGYKGIKSDNKIKGRIGIFAVQEDIVSQSTFMKMVRTGVFPAAKTDFSVSIPKLANSWFKSVRPIGPYTLWKWAGGVRFAPPGSINTTTGVFTPSAHIIGTRALIYGPDALFYSFLTGVGIKTWWELSE